MILSFPKGANIRVGECFFARDANGYPLYLKFEEIYYEEDDDSRPVSCVAKSLDPQHPGWWSLDLTQCDITKDWILQ